MSSSGVKKVLCGVFAALMLVLGAGVSGQAKAADLRAGQAVRFGEWYGEPLIWYVLYIDGGRAMLMLKDNQLPARPFHKEKSDVTWEKCSLRQWLNDEFYHIAFSGSEQERVAESAVPAHKNTAAGASAGRDTKDRVFLLSACEARKMLQEGGMRAFANAAGEKKSWWLRSCGFTAQDAANVSADGTVSNDGAVNIALGVRPVLWMKQ